MVIFTREDYMATLAHEWQAPAIWRIAAECRIRRRYWLIIANGIYYDAVIVTHC